MCIARDAPIPEELKSILPTVEQLEIELENAAGEIEAREQEQHTD
ncbi:MULTISPECIES: hypothetical protein [Leptolyngbya]|nr:hypothetical protein [Leptolyngbya sp. FACHB-1624]